MIYYKLIKTETSEVYQFEKLVTEALREGWELAGSVVASSTPGRLGFLVQPMTKDVITRTEWLSGEASE